MDVNAPAPAEWCSQALAHMWAPCLWVPGKLGGRQQHPPQVRRAVGAGRGAAGFTVKDLAHRTGEIADVGHEFSLWSGPGIGRASSRGIRPPATVKQLPGQPSLVLLSLSDPDWPGAQWTSPGAPAPWIYRSYADLIGVLEQVRPEIDEAEDGFAGLVLDRWLAMLKRVQMLSELVGCPGLDEPLDLDADTGRELQRLRLDAPVQKMRYQLVAVRIRSVLAGEVPGADISAGLTNRAGLVQGSIDTPGPRLGWQLQRQQFRLTFVVFDGPGHGRSAKEQEARKRLARRNEAFFAFPPIQ